jgi:hypothetical protein
MAHADMAEGIEHAFVRQQAVGECDLVAEVGKIFGHWAFLLSTKLSCSAATAAGAKPK